MAIKPLSLKHFTIKFIFNRGVTFICNPLLMFGMVKQILGGRGRGNKIAQYAPALVQAKLMEVQQVINNYSNCNPFTVLIAAKMQEQLTLMQEAVVAGNLQLFWAVYNRLCKQLLQYGVVIPSYIKNMYRLR